MESFDGYIVIPDCKILYEDQNLTNHGRDGAMMPIDILMDGDDGKWLTDGRRMMEE